MGYRIIAREDDGSLLHSSDFIDRDRAIAWAGDLALVGVEILRIEGDGEVIPAETVSAACSARAPASSAVAAA